MAATSVLKLVVDDKEYSASLKNAKTGMQALQDSLQAAGKTFLDVDKRVVEYARALGQMETTSKSARGRIGEMSTAFVELSLQYKHLTDQEKESPLGKAMSESLETLKTRVIDAKKELADFENQLKDVDELKVETPSGGLFGGKSLTDMMSVAGGNLIATGISTLTSELTQSIQQSIELARQGEGVRIAFERLNQPNLLANLKEATHGTVSELELMKQAIKFDNFKLPLEDLSTYLAFAQQKAKDTGESIDYLVDSIVTGLGRQSKQILDNLGISASELTKRMNEGATMTQAVAEIIREEMAKAGDYVETAADRAARAAADATNEMERLGREAQPFAEEWASVWNELKIGGMSVLTMVLGPIADSIRSIRELLSEEYELKIKANIPNLADGPQPSPSKSAGTDHKVQAPGGYVQVTDTNTGAVIGGKHFDNLQDSNTISDWKKSLFKSQASGKSKSLPTYDEFEKQSSKSILNTEELKKGVDMLSPYQMMLPEIKKNILDIKDADLGGSLAKLGNDKVKKEIDDMTKSLKAQNMAFGMASQSANNLSAALAGMDDPAARAAGTVISAIANIALGFGQAVASAGSMGPWAWLAYVAAGTAALATTISTVHSLTGYAQGGIVSGEGGGMISGTTYSSDQIPILANAGEVILNRAQQGVIAQQLQGSGSTVNVVGRVVGEDIFLSADRYARRSGRGAILTGKNL